MFRLILALTFTGAALTGQEAPRTYRLEAGTRIPLTMINSVGTKQAQAGDPVYLQTAFPILSGGRIVVPVGSHATGTVTEVRRAGKVKGRSEIHVRFDTLLLPNGVSRDFRAALAGLDTSNPGKLDRAESGVEGAGNIGGDARTLAGTAVTGAVLGGAVGGGVSIIGGARSFNGFRGWQRGAGIGAAAGATAGLIFVLATRGPDAVLARGSSVEIVLDRPVEFAETELTSSPR